MRFNLAATARNALQPPLRFGDVNQIWAVQILVALAELSELYAALPEKTRKCGWCDGEGVRKCGECGHKTECRECGGSGLVIIQFDENEWIDAEHLRKHLDVMRAELAERRGGAAA